MKFIRKPTQPESFDAIEIPEHVSIKMEITPLTSNKYTVSGEGGDFILINSYGEIRIEKREPFLEAYIPLPEVQNTQTLPNTGTSNFASQVPVDLQAIYDQQQMMQQVNAAPGFSLGRRPQYIPQ
jgi:hypothetical protein